VTIDATNAFGNGKLLPAGILRESLSGIKRADCIVITRANESSALEQLRAEINHLTGSIPTFVSHIKLTDVRALDRRNSAADLTARKIPIVAFCGIGNPNSFFTLLRSERYDVVYTRKFPDHHNYTQGDINQIVRDASARGAQALVTTSKDSVKLRSLAFGLPCYVVDTTIHIDQAEAFFRLVNDLIQR